MMDGGGAYGAAKAGAAFDPITFVKRPPIILRALCWLFSIIVFGCISSQGYDNGKCLYDGDNNACRYGVGIGVIAFIASIGFIVGEYFFEQMSSVKTRKHYVLLDLGFSALWSFLFFVGFCYLTNRWSAVEEAPVIGKDNMQAAIAFSFFSIFTWAGCAYFAFMRYRQGTASAFAPSYEADPTALPGATAYASYPGGPDAPGGGYQEPPFGAPQGQTQGDFNAPTY